MANGIANGKFEGKTVTKIIIGSRKSDEDEFA